MQLSCSFILGDALATIHATNCRGVHPRLALISGLQERQFAALSTAFSTGSLYSGAENLSLGSHRGWRAAFLNLKVPTSKRNVSPALPTLPSGQTIYANLIHFRRYRDVHSIVDRSHVGHLRQFAALVRRQKLFILTVSAIHVATSRFCQRFFAFLFCRAVVSADGNCVN